MNSIELFGAPASFTLNEGLVHVLELSIFRCVENPSEEGASGQSISLWVLYLVFGF